MEVEFTAFFLFIGGMFLKCPRNSDMEVQFFRFIGGMFFKCPRNSSVERQIYNFIGKGKYFMTLKSINLTFSSRRWSLWFLFLLKGSDALTVFQGFWMK